MGPSRQPKKTTRTIKAKNMAGTVRARKPTVKSNKASKPTAGTNKTKKTA